MASSRQMAAAWRFLRSTEITTLAAEPLRPGIRVVYDLDDTTESPEASRVQMI